MTRVPSRLTEYCHWCVLASSSIACVEVLLLNHTLIYGPAPTRVKTAMQVRVHVYVYQDVRLP